MSVSDNKKFFWLKLKKDFFTSRRIKKLRSMAGGDTFVIIYLKLQLLALDKGGVLTFEQLEDTMADELALDIDENPDNVRVTLAFMVKYGLCETSDEVNFFLPYCVENTGSETGAAQRMREQRKLNKSNIREQIGTSREHCSPEIELEIEKELDKEVVVDIKKTSQDCKNRYLINTENSSNLLDDINNKEKTTTATTAVMEEYEKNIGKATPAIEKRIKALVEEVGDKTVMDAIEEAAAMNIRNYKYMAAIARGHKGKKKERQIEPGDRGYKHIDPDCHECHGTGEVTRYLDGNIDLPIKIDCPVCCRH